MNLKVSIGILPGKGGAGKTKLIQAFSEEFSTLFPDTELRFMAGGIAPTAAALDELPLRPCVIIVDDAQRSSDLRPLYFQNWEDSHTKVWRIWRPKHWDRICRFTPPS